ncbi:Na(+)/H(+) antiporter subunit F [Corynebacterium kutscheri]|uniref:Multisubunit Na+/H+ antiporter, MnhF subunit n=1 Tax=Corynebacterium kutscheri TaxID=35755 RepID=A0A0F6TEC3_9CORY|nr:monovalent cation/H+ antiporter complex subunit F [Corynebacterium kutscheri]AKE41996.1 multisubunit Na+/H+ antiporter, MnhF subunit [Corynebacterium kutscheri]VEH06199.1 Na(+)/H(+) antiporter subunit F [Corynebacterium kutscheri]VEH10337.1 Na(+)/H(+) antiporter subunit F [Corynebacterium kutscheri]VEH82114.1 Na(+)/H(+) antiporter subunit F [Corynebacterium kutscheri]
MNPDLYNGFLLVIAIIFATSFILTCYRILVGPNSVDRVVSMDAVAAMVQCALAIYICWTLDTTVTNAMIVVALLGFISTIAIARYRKKDASRS